MKNINAIKSRTKLAVMVWLFLAVLSISWGQNPLQVQDDFCSDADLQITETHGTDAACCFLEITYKETWTTTVGGSALTLPYGIELAMTSPTIITGVTSKTGAWISSSLTATSLLPADLKFTRNPIPNPSGSADQWIPYNPANSGRWIPSQQTQTFRVCLNHTGLGPITFNVYVLNGNTPARACIRTFTLNVTPGAYAANPQDPGICAGKSTSINLTPIPPSGSTITWYSYQPTSTNSGCPTAIPPSAPWSLATTNGTATYFTNPISDTRCYVAVIKAGCFSYVSSIARVSVCPNPNGIGLSPSSISIHPWDQQYHKCGSYAGTVSLTGIDPNLCDAKIKWFINGTLQASTGLTLGPLNLGVNATDPCNTFYTISATVTTACQPVANPSITIIVDKSGIIPTLVYDVGPLLCPKQGAVLTANPNCGRIISWEISTNGSTWSPIPGAGTSSTYWTNQRPPGSTTWYRVWAKNFDCAAVPSLPVNLTVKSLLTATISPSKICLGGPGPTTITASTSYTPVTYQWFHNGSPYPGTTQSINATDEGFYQVLVSDPVCGTTAWSNVVTICRISVEIAGPPCVCAGKPIVLNAVPFGKCTGACTYSWTSTSGFTGSGATVTDQNPNFGSGSTISYNLTMNCGTGCVSTAGFTVTRCQP